MTEELLLKAIGNVGVPAAICFYTLFGVNKTLKELTETINRMALGIKKINKLKRQVDDIAAKVADMNRKE